jgi:hypothetical protein
MPSNPPEATGTITEIYVAQDMCAIRLDIPAAEAPNNGLFNLPLKTPNYNAMYSLILAAAANRWPLTIRVSGNAPITPALNAIVAYVVVHWPAGS